AERSDGVCQIVDLAVGDAGQLDDERCCTCCLVPAQEFGPPEFDLASEKRDSEDCRGDRQGSQARPQPGLAQVNEGEPQEPAPHSASTAVRARCLRAVLPAYPRRSILRPWGAHRLSASCRGSRTEVAVRAPRVPRLPEQLYPSWTGLLRTWFELRPHCPKRKPCQPSAAKRSLD